jgi:aspartyl-tRNA(Asn)/glutamyl-tRNA(Gln) amidotransferase subunit A
LRAALDYGRRAGAERLARAAREVAKVRAEAAAWLESYEFLLLPTTPQAAFAFDAPLPVSQADFTVLASVAGLPAISLPTETSADGMPIGAQLVAARGAEARLLSLAACLD